MCIVDYITSIGFIVFTLGIGRCHRIYVILIVSNVYGFIVHVIGIIL